MPPFPRSVVVERMGVLFIVIGETGGVESAIITEPLDRAYDRMLLASTKTWSYRPATRMGVPVSTEGGFSSRCRVRRIDKPGLCWSIRWLCWGRTWPTPEARKPGPVFEIDHVRSRRRTITDNLPVDQRPRM
jgi:hypothetical protein